MTLSAMRRRDERRSRTLRRGRRRAIQPSGRPEDRPGIDHLDRRHGRRAGRDACGCARLRDERAGACREPTRRSNSSTPQRGSCRRRRAWVPRPSHTSSPSATGRTSSRCDDRSGRAGRPRSTAHRATTLGGRDARGPRHVRRTRPMPDRTPTCGPRASGPPCDQRVEPRRRARRPRSTATRVNARPRRRARRPRSTTHETPALAGGREQRRARRPRSTALRATHARRARRPRSTALSRRTARTTRAGETPAVHHTRDRPRFAGGRSSNGGRDARSPRHVRRTAQPTDRTPTCGPRASGPPCDQRVETRRAGETPAVHGTSRDQRSAGETPVVHGLSR